MLRWWRPILLLERYTRMHTMYILHAGRLQPKPRVSEALGAGLCDFFKSSISSPAISGRLGFVFRDTLNSVREDAREPPRYSFTRIQSVSLVSKAQGPLRSWCEQPGAMSEMPARIARMHRPRGTLLEATTRAASRRPFEWCSLRCLTCGS
jgi:hypothetical protein